jgi:small ubiquitin-related modifier
MKSCFDVFSEYRGVDPYSTRYMLNGRHLDPKETVKMLELKINDRIQVLPGIYEPHPVLKSEGPDGEIVEHVQWVTVRFREQSGEVTSFKVKGSTRMKAIFESFAEKKGIALDSVRFMLDGNRLHSGLTAKMLDLDEDGHIDVFPYSHGGSL